MASEINQLGHHLDRISERNRLFRDFTLPSLVRALREVIAAFPVYRTYVGDDGGEPTRARPRLHRARGGQRQAPEPHRQRLGVRLRPRRAAPAPSRRPPDPEERRGAAPLRHALPADHRARHGQGRRGHRALPLQPPRVAERGGQRSRPLRRVAGGLSRQERAPAGRAGRRRSLATATHDTKRGEDVRARINVLSEVPAALGGRGAALARDRPPVQARRRRPRPRPTGTTSTCSTRRSSARGPSATTDEPLEALHRAHPRLHGEGDEGGQAPHELGESQRRLRRRRRGVRHAACSRRAAPFSRGLAPVPRGRRARWRRQLAGADPAQDRRPGHSRLLPGRRALGSLAGRSRQSTSRSTSRAQAVAARRPDTRASPPSRPT